MARLHPLLILLAYIVPECSAFVAGLPLRQRAQTTSTKLAKRHFRRRSFPSHRRCTSSSALFQSIFKNDSDSASSYGRGSGSDNQSPAYSIRQGRRPQSKNSFLTSLFSSQSNGESSPTISLGPPVQERRSKLEVWLGETVSTLQESSPAFAFLTNWYEDRVDERASQNVPPRPLAREGHWAAYLDDNEGLVYYFNTRSGESTWDPPTATFPKVEAPAEVLVTDSYWSACLATDKAVDVNGIGGTYGGSPVFFYNWKTSESTWDPPSESFPQVPLATREPWTAYFDPATRRVYYFNPDTNDSLWDAPTNDFPTFDDSDLLQKKKEEDDAASFWKPLFSLPKLEMSKKEQKQQTEETAIVKRSKNVKTAGSWPFQNLEWASSFLPNQKKDEQRSQEQQQPQAVSSQKSTGILDQFNSFVGSASQKSFMGNLSNSWKSVPSEKTSTPKEQSGFQLQQAKWLEQTVKNNAVNGQKVNGQKAVVSSTFDRMPGTFKLPVQQQQQQKPQASNAYAVKPLPVVADKTKSSNIGTVVDTPKKVYRLAKWEQNSDRTITGLLRSSNQLTCDQLITTSPAVGIPRRGKVVQTKSGSYYFLL